MHNISLDLLTVMISDEPDCGQDKIGNDVGLYCSTCLSFQDKLCETCGEVSVISHHLGFENDLEASRLFPSTWYCGQCEAYKHWKKIK